MVDIVIFEDHADRRQALQMLVNMQPDMQCTGAYENCAGLVDNLKQKAPDVALMDIDMPEVNGIEGILLLRRHYPETLIIMQTIFGDDDRIFSSIQAGANGYILKSVPPAKLIDAIREVMSGGSPMTPAVATKVLQLFRQQAPAAASPEMKFDLSPREIEILSLLVKGYSHKMVAAELGISIFTVNNHIKNIYQKLHVHSSSEVVAVALKKKLV